MGACVYCGRLCESPHDGGRCEDCDCPGDDRPTIVKDSDGDEVARCECKCHRYIPEEEWPETLRDHGQG